MLPKVVIWGAGGHALVVADIVRQARQYQIAGFLDDTKPGRTGAALSGSTVLGGREQLPRLREQGVSHALLAIGDCEGRLRLAEVLTGWGFVLATAVHPRAVIADDVRLGPGTVVAAAAVVNPGVAVGANVIVNTGAIVEHECVIDDGAHLCPRTVLAGQVRVGRAAWVGVGATVKDRVSIGPGAFIGAGAVVLGDIPAHVMAYGVPARVLRPTSNHQRSLEQAPGKVPERE